jgi:hypothetical protein
LDFCPFAFRLFITQQIQDAFYQFRAANVVASLRTVLREVNYSGMTQYSKMLRDICLRCWEQFLDISHAFGVFQEFNHNL